MTLANGKSATVQATTTKNADGTLSTEASRTGFNGRTQTIDTTTIKTESGRTTIGTVTNENGTTATINTTAWHGDGRANKTTTLTGPNGKTAEREVSTTKNSDGTTTRVIEATKPDGTKETRTETFSTKSGPTP